MQDTKDQLSELFAQYHDALERYCHVLVHHDRRYDTLAEDAVQIAFLKAVLHPERFNASPNPYGWLATCAKNHIRSKLRQQKHRAEIVGRQVSIEEYHDVEDPSDAIIRWIDQSESRERINAIYAALTEQEKIVFKDYYQQNCSLKETASRNDLSCESVRGAVQRIRSKAKKLKLPMMIILIGQCIFAILRTV